VVSAIAALVMDTGTIAASTHSQQINTNMIQVDHRQRIVGMAANHVGEVAAPNQRRVHPSGHQQHPHHLHALPKSSAQIVDAGRSSDIPVRDPKMVTVVLNTAGELQIL
jgi:hypothetical protein